MRRLLVQATRLAVHCRYSSSTARKASSIARRSARDRAPANRRNLVRSTARIWSQTATESLPAEGTATMMGGREGGPVDNGTTTTVRRARFNPSALMTTAGRCF